MNLEIFVFLQPNLKENTLQHLKLCERASFDNGRINGLQNHNLMRDFTTLPNQYRK